MVFCLSRDPKQNNLHAAPIMPSVNGRGTVDGRGLF